VFTVFIYLQGFRIEMPVKSSRFYGQRESYAVKLFYTSNMPIMLESTLMSNAFIVSQMLSHRFPDNFFVRLLGVWSAARVRPWHASSRENTPQRLRGPVITKASGRGSWWRWDKGRGADSGQKSWFERSSQLLPVEGI